MKETFLQLLIQAGPFAFFVSVFISVLVSIAGVLPSIFITVANLLFFGLPVGIIVSIIGEAIGAIVSFLLYRKGIKKWKDNKTFQNSLLVRLEQVESNKAFWIIVSLRILPFVPSGAVTLGSAMSKVSLGIFASASTLGKLPALVIEAGAIYGFLHVDVKWKIGISIAVLILLLLKIKK